MSVLKLKLNNEVKYAVAGVFGRGASNSYPDYDLTPEEVRDAIDDWGGSEMFRYFNTRPEAEAYLQGLEDMDGWMDYYIADESEVERHQQIFGTLSEFEIINN